MTSPAANKKILFLLLGIVLLGFSLRVRSLLVGLPSETGRLTSHHFDEYLTFSALGAMNPAKLDFFPNDVLYWGTVQVYLQGAVLKGMQAAGIFTPGGKEYFKENPRMADRMYISGRLLTITFSCLSIILLFYISAGILSGYFALIPPLFLSLAYVDIYMASLVKPDSIMMFFGLCSVYFCFKAARGEGGLKTQLLAGAFCGLSFGTKYTGLVFGFPYVAAAVYRAVEEKAPGKWLARLAAYALAFSSAYLAVNPYFIFRNSDVLSYMKVTFLKTVAAESCLAAYAEYFTQLLPAALGWPAAALGLAASFYSLFFGRKPELRIAGAFAAVYLLKFGCGNDLIFTYTIPLVPFFALSCGYFLEKKASSKLLPVALTALAFLYTAAYSVYHRALWADSNTKSEASAWLEKSVSPDSLVCVSKVDVWTPKVLRRYSPGLRLRAFSGSSDVMADGLEALGRGLQTCDYVVLSEFEIYLMRKKDALGLVQEKIDAGFEKVAEFRRPRPFLFVPSSSHQYLGVDLLNPDTLVYKNKKR